MEVLSSLFYMLLEPMSAGLLTVTGILCGIKTHWVQFRCFAKSMRLPFQKQKKDGKMNSFSAAMTALAGTIGTGNIIGVAAAIEIGGSGAIFWMCVAAVLEMAVKYTEIFLACKTRKGNHGGPMYYITDLLHAKWAGKIFAILCIGASFFIGDAAQTNAVGIVIKQLPVSGRTLYGLMFIVAGLFCLLLFIAMCGGGKRITKIAGVLTPIMALGYLIGCLTLIVLRINRLPQAVASIIMGAFGMRQMAGGFCGSIWILAVKSGFTRGLFTNESGLGSAPIVHAAADEEPHTAGLWGIFEVFFDTIIMCSVTALSLLVSDVTASGNGCYGMTAAVWEAAFGVSGNIFLIVALFCFAFAAALGWGFYGSRSIYFLFGKGKTIQTIYIIVFVMMGFAGFFSSSESILMFSDMVNTALVLLNTGAICLILCAKCINISENKRLQKKTIKNKRINVI